MPDDLREYAGALVVLRCWCGIQLAVPSSLREEQVRRHHDDLGAITIYCPLGHAFVPSGERKTAALERRIENLTQRLATEQDAHRSTELSLRAEKGAKTKLKKRIAAGVCPCCKRSFQNLARHMSGQHPGWSDHA